MSSIAAQISARRNPSRGIGAFAGLLMVALLTACESESPSRPASPAGGSAAARLIQNFETQAKRSPTTQNFEIPSGGDTWVFASSKALTLQSMPSLKLPLNSSEATRLRHENAMVDSAMIARVNETGIAEIQHFLIPVRTDPPVILMQAGEMITIRRDETGTWTVGR